MENRPSAKQLDDWAKKMQRQLSYDPMYDGPAYFHSAFFDEEDDDDKEKKEE